MTADEWSDHDEHDAPLQDKRPFGAGLKRKRVVFVPASEGNLSSTTEARAPAKSSKSISDLYLSMVLPKDGSQAASTEDADAAAPQICHVCSLPMDESPDGVDEDKPKPSSRPHEASIAHQVCMTHSHPPSALDRSRVGLNILQTQGWDPDSRTGLGAARQGRQYPIKVKPKHDTLGIGVEVPKGVVAKKKKVQKVDAKKARKMADEDKKRHEKLRRQFYGNPEVERYLGNG